MGGYDELRVAVVQLPPVLLDGPATLAAAVDHLHAAADAGAQLVVFPETYVPGYPVWIWRLRPEADSALSSTLHRQLLDNSVDLTADGLRPLREAAGDRDGLRYTRTRGHVQSGDAVQHGGHHRV